MLETILGIALKEFFSVLLQTVLGWVQRQEELQAAKKRGAGEVVAKVNKEAADAERRAAEVPELDRDTAADKLDGGLF